MRRVAPSGSLASSCSSCSGVARLWEQHRLRPGGAELRASGLSRSEATKLPDMDHPSVVQGVRWCARADAMFDVGSGCEQEQLDFEPSAPPSSRLGYTTRGI